MWQASILFAHIEIQATNVRLLLACSKHIAQVSQSVVLFLRDTFYFIQASSWEVTCISETAFLPPRTLFLSSPNRRLCSIFPQKCNTSWANFNEVHLHCFLYEQVLAAHILQLVFPVYFYYRVVPIAERSGLMYPCLFPALFPARATNSRLAEHLVHWRLLLWYLCMSEPEKFRFFGFVHDKL